MAIEGLDTRQQLAVVADRDQHLCVAAHGGLEDGQGTRAEFVLLKQLDLIFSVGSLRQLIQYGAFAGSRWGHGWADKNGCWW